MSVNYPGLSPIAVVVSLYNPEPEIVERCAGWVRSVGPVFAVDDGSPDPAVRDVLDALVARGVTVLVNHRNAGIARALNVGISRALREVRPEWILTMDQDSELGEGYLDAAQTSLAAARTADRVGMLCAEWIGQMHAPIIRNRDGIDEVREPIQSGMLMRASMIQLVGLFDESLFIDAVDTDFVARARLQGWVAAPIVDGRLRHSLGETVPITVGGRDLIVRGKKRHVIYHAPFRSYYMSRNQFRLIGRYLLKKNGIPADTVLANFMILGVVALFTDDRSRQRRAMCLGVWDAFLDKYGPMGIAAREELGLALPSAVPAPAAIPRGFAQEQIAAQILLSTWNGQEYVGELLESLLSQETQAQVHILVRDDGSTDDTVSIVKQFAATDERITVIEGENIGVDRSFHALLTHASHDADIYFYCDQDDVWLPDKVQSAVEALSDRIGGALPALYCSRSMVTDSTLHPIGPTRDYDKPSLAQALVINIAPGHTMAFNAALFALVRDHFDADSMMVFDHWTYLIAAGLGSVVFDHEWHTWYRNHTSNAIGYSVRESAQSRIKVAAEMDFSAYTRQAAAFERAFGDRLDPRAASRLRGFVDQGSVLTRLQYLKRFGIQHGSTVTSMGAAVLFVAGRYRRASN